MKKKLIQRLALLLAGVMLFSGCGLIEKYQKIGEMESVLASLEAEKENEKETTAVTETEAAATEAPHDTYQKPSETEVTEAQKEARARFDEVRDEFLTRSLQNAGLNIHDYVEHPEDFGVEITDYVLYSHEEDEDEVSEDILEWLYEEMKTFEFDDLAWNQQIFYDKVMYEQEMTEKYADVTEFDTLLSTNNGLISNLTIAFYEYRFVEKKDIDEYLLFLQDVPNCMQDIVDGAAESIEQGYAPSDAMLENNIDVLTKLCEEEDNPLLDGFAEKLAKCDFIDGDEAAAYMTANEQIVKELLMPSFEETKKALEGWVGTLPELKGLCQYEGGDDYYEYLIEMYTGSGMNAEEMYDYLYENMQKYMDAMYTLIYSNQSVLDAYMNNEYDFPYEDPKDILDALAKQAAKEFPAIEDPGVQVSYLPEVMEVDGMLAYYLTPQIDVDQINTVRLNGSALADSQSTTYSTLGHEGYPGHLYAYNYMKQNKQHPAEHIFSYLGYGEGWAEYAGSTSLGWWGLDKSVVKLLQIDGASSQVMTGLIDVGVNGLGWGLDEVADIIEEFYGMPASSAQTKEAAQSYYDFVTDTPGIILSYSVGYLKVIDMRNAFKKAAGKKYSDRAFYEAYLNVGETPFYLTEKYILQQVEK